MTQPAPGAVLVSELKLPTDTAPRYALFSDGTQQFGSGSAPLDTTLTRSASGVLAVNGGQLGGTAARFDVTAYGAVGDGVTDDTAAIQAAVNAAFAYANAHSYYAEVYFPVPAKWYAILGPLIKGGATLGCAQITLPIQPVASNKVTLAFIGQRDVSATIHWQQAVRQITGVTLKSNSDTALDGTNGEASIVGGPTPAKGYGTSGSLFSNMMVYWDGIALMGPNTTNGIGGLDLRGVAACGGGSFSYLPDASPAGGGIVGGSGSGNYFGIALPNNGNNDVSFWNSITVYARTYAAILGEHTHVNAFRGVYNYHNCVIVGTFYSGPTALHGVTINNCSAESVTTGGSHLLFVGTGAKCHIVLDTEDANVVITDQNATRANTGDVYLIGSYTSTLTLPASTSGVTIHNSTQPAGNVAAPGIPSSTTNLQNTFGRPAAVCVNGGTVTAIKVDGVTQGVTSGVVVVPAGINISITYSVVPTSWVWTLI